MRTTLSIDDHLLAAAKDSARRKGVTLGKVVEEALRRELGRVPQALERPLIPVFTAGSGPRAGVDLTSNRSLLEALDEGQPLDRRR